MRFTPTDKYLMYARSAAKTVRWLAYFRVVGSLDVALTSGAAWTDASDHLTDVPDFSSFVEHDICQFSTDSVQLAGKGITWWEDNFFSAATETDYIEFKIRFELGGHPDWCTDTAVIFSGFVDHVRRKRNEATDSVTFSVFTAQDMGDRIPAEVLTIQPINADIDTLGTSGLALFELPRIYIKSAAISGKNLVVGSHTIAYQYNDGAPIIRLDDGEYTTLAASADTTLYNADISQAVTVYTMDLAQVPKSTTEILVYIVVISQGDTLPYVWPHCVSVDTMLKRILSLLGISNVTVGTLSIQPYDAVPRVSFLEQPPEDNSFAYRWAMQTDGTDLWIGVGNKLYKRTVATGAYTLKATLTTGYIITRIWYDSGGYVWLYAQESATNISGHLLRHTIATGVNSSEVALANSSRYAIDFLSGRGIVYVNTTTRAVREVPSSTMTDTLVYANTDMGYTGTDGPGVPLFIRSGKVWIQTVDAGVYYWHEIYYAAGWADEGKVLTLSGFYEVMGYHASEDRIYFVDVTSGKVKSHTGTSATTTDVLTLAQTDTLIESMYYGNSRVYFTTPGTGYLYSLASNAASLLNVSPQVYTGHFSFAYIDRLYGIDAAGMLYQFYASLELYITNARFDGETVTGAMRRILTAFMLAGNIRSTKSAFIYPRTNSSGALITTGSTFTITEAEACDIDEEREYVSEAQLVEVANAETRWTFDGTNWNAMVLSTARTVSLSSDLIPSEIVRDLCYQAWQFFKNSHNLVTITLTAQPYFQYEPFDGCALTVAGNNIPLSTTGVLYGTTAQRDGSTIVKVLV